MLPKAHLTSHSRMSGSRWVSHHCDYLGQKWKSFLYISSLYPCHLFLITSTSVTSTLFLSFIEPIFAWKILLVSLIFLKRSLVFPILLFSSICLHWSLRKAFLSLLAILWNSAFRWMNLSFSPLPLLLFFSQLFVRPLQTTILPFCISSSWGWFWSLPPVQGWTCTSSLTDGVPSPGNLNLQWSCAQSRRYWELRHMMAMLKRLSLNF